MKPTIENNPFSRMSARFIALALLILLLLASAATLVLSYLTWVHVSRLSRPELSIDRVSLNFGDRDQQSVVIDLRNVGRTRMDWLGIALKLFANNLEVEQTITTVHTNPIPAGVGRQSTTVLPQQGPLLLALCTRWLDDRHRLSTAEWFYHLDPPVESRTRSYSDATPREKAFMGESHPCREVFGDL